MKSRILILAALFVALSFSGVYAQVTSATATASAEILGTLNIVHDGTDINFGNLPDTQPAVIFLDPTGEANSNTGSNTSVARFDITGDDDADITILYEDEIVLTNGTPAQDFSFSPRLAHADENTAIAQASATPISGGTNSLKLSGDGEISVWVGGEIAAGTLNGQNGGTYTGEFLVTVEYQ